MNKQIKSLLLLLLFVCTLFLTQASAMAEPSIRQIHAMSEGNSVGMIQASTAARPAVHPINSANKYDANTDLSVYCANVSRHFVSDTIYEAEGQWEQSGLYSALSYVFTNGVTKRGGLAESKYSTGDSSKDQYLTQFAVWCVLYAFGVKDRGGLDAGIDINTSKPVAGYEDVYDRFQKLYADAIYYAEKNASGDAETPYFTLTTDGNEIVFKNGKELSEINFITSAAEPGYAFNLQNRDQTGGGAEPVILTIKEWNPWSWWVFEKTGAKDEYRICNHYSKTYLDAGTSPSAGQAMQVQEKASGDRQIFRLVKNADGSVSFLSKANPNLALEVRQGVYTSGTVLQLANKSGASADQRFLIEQANLPIRTLTSDGKYICTQWIEPTIRGDLIESQYSFEGNTPLPGTVLEYEHPGEAASRFRVKIPVSSLPDSGYYDMELYTEARFSQPAIMYLAIDDERTQELLVGGNTKETGASDRIRVFIEPVLLSLKKQSALPQFSNGNRSYSLAGATYGVYRDKACKDQIRTLVCKEDGTSNEVPMNPGTYYLKEIVAGKGYLLDARIHEIQVKTEDLCVSVEDTPATLSLSLLAAKRDAELLKQEAIADAQLSGAEFVVKYFDVNSQTDPEAAGEQPKKTWVFRTDAKGEIHPEAEDAFVEGDELYLLDGKPVFLPGSYSFRERKAPEGYLTNDTLFVGQITCDNPRAPKVVQTNFPTGDASVSEQVKRGDIRFRKTDEHEHPLSHIPFVITELATGEAHIVLTDENGVFRSARYAHDEKTNQLDAYLKKYDAEVGIPDEALADHRFGCWFGLGQDGSMAKADPKKAAFPYGRYTITELRCEANRGYELIEDLIFVVDEDKQAEAAGEVIDLNNLRDLPTPPETPPEEPEIPDTEEPSIGTTALDEATGAHVSSDSGEVRLIDTIYYSGLDTNADYYAQGMLVDQSGEPILVDGKPITAESAIFRPAEPTGSVAVIFQTDATLFDGQSVVVFERLYQLDEGTQEGKTEVASHLDPDDPGQTIHFPKIRTSARDERGGGSAGSIGEEEAIIDRVSYSNLAVGATYKVRGTLMDKESGEPLGITTESAPFVAHAADGTIELRFPVDTRAYSGKTIVVFEDLLLIRQDKKEVRIASHADLSDVSQSIRYPQAPTPAKAAPAASAPASAKTRAVKTGDENHPAFYLALLGISGLVIALTKRRILLS